MRTRMHKQVVLFTCILLGLNTPAVSSRLPAEFDPKPHKVVSAKGWLYNPPSYQWLPDGGILFWRGKRDNPQARLFAVGTGKLQPLTTFNRAYKATPPKLASVYDSVSPDGKHLLSLLGGFETRPQAWRTLEIAGAASRLHPLQKSFRFTLPVAWEWNEHYQGWVNLGEFRTSDRGGVQAVAHINLAHPSEPRIVELSHAALPAWYDNTSPLAFSLVAVRASGEGILVPTVANLDTMPLWKKQHTFPLAFVDIRQGTQAAREHLISLPAKARVEEYAVSPDTLHIVWRLEFHQPHTLPDRAKRYATDELWISDIEGSSLHRLGYQAVRFANASDLSPQQGLCGLAWKNNRTLSFVLDDTLCTLSLQSMRANGYSRKL